VQASVVRVCTQGGPFAGVSAATMKRRAARMLELLGLGGAELSVALVDDEVIHALNRDYRKKDKPTDVLAFAMEEGEAAPRGGGARVLGDVILSVDTARRQAAERRRPLLDELTMLLAHGLLHLLGYDHRTDKEERRMTAKTHELEQAGAARGRM
jgi:probable rRNA maturation factor